jgi:hypothetical protein
VGREVLLGFNYGGRFFGVFQKKNPFLLNTVSLLLSQLAQT